MVKIFSLEGCVPCKQAKYIFDKKKIDYEVVDFNDYRAQLCSEGFNYAPVFEVDGHKTQKLYRAIELKAQA